MSEPLSPPTGYASWLDYAIATMDTRGLYLESIAGEGPVIQRHEMRAAARAELDALRREVDMRAEASPTGTLAARCKWWANQCDDSHDEPIADPPEVLGEHSGNTDRRESWAGSSWLYPGDRVVIERKST